MNENAGASIQPDQAWRDELTELHILAHNGDAGAADVAARWCAEDPVARQVWDEVENACGQVQRTATPAS